MPRRCGRESAGLMTTVLPNASAGATFQAGMASGKFHGVIETDDPDRLVPDLDVDAGPDGIEDLAVTADRLAREYLNVEPVRPASPMASASGFPISRASSRPSSSLRARISVPARSSTRIAAVASRRPSRECLARRGNCLGDLGGSGAGEFADNVGEIRGIHVACALGRIGWAAAN